MLTALLMGNGCQTWQSSSSIPGLKLDKSQRQVLSRVAKDPFPTASDVGLETVKK